MADRILSLGSGSTLVKGFFSWWFGELQRLLPEQFRTVARRRSDYLITTQDGETLSFHRLRGNRCSAVGSVDLTGFMGDPAEAAQRILAEDVKRGTSLVLRLDASQGLRRVFSLPSQAETNLRQVLQHEMDRRTPWRAEEVLFDYEIIERRQDTNQISVRLTVVPRKTIDQALSRLREVGLTPDIVDLLDRDPEIAPRINLLDGGGQGRARSKSRLFFPLSAIGIIAGLAIVFFMVHQRDKTLDNLTEELKIARQEAEESAQLLRDIERLKNENSYLIGKKLKLPSAAVLLEVLSRLLPDDTWLVEFEIKGDTVRLLGYSSDATALLPLIEDAEQFFEVQFKSPVVRDYELGSDRFHIAARVAEGTGRSP